MFEDGGNQKAILELRVGEEKRNAVAVRGQVWIDVTINHPSRVVMMRVKLSHKLPPVIQLIQIHNCRFHRFLENPRLLHSLETLLMTDLAGTNLLKKVERLWYEDADVVFCAGKSKFRVHRGILSAQSTIFRDMFTVPQGDAEVGNTVKTNIDSLTVITLPDNDRDVHYFFLAIFDVSFYGAPPSKYPLHVTASILRLAHKYDVPFLMLRAIAHLDRLFPLHITDSNDASEDDDCDDNNDSLLSSSEIIGGYLDMIPIAEAANVDWIVPSIFRTLVTNHDIQFIMENPVFGRLSSNHQVLIVRCEVNKAMEDQNTNSWLGILPSENCLNKTICGRLARTFQKADKDLPLRFKCVRDVDSTHLAEDRFCYKCQNAGEEHNLEMQEKFWNEYWSLYGYDDRDEAKGGRELTINNLKRRITKFNDVKFL